MVSILMTVNDKDDGNGGYDNDDTTININHMSNNKSSISIILIITIKEHAPKTH